MMSDMYFTGWVSSDTMPVSCFTTVHESSSSGVLVARISILDGVSKVPSHSELIILKRKLLSGELRLTCSHGYSLAASGELHDVWKMY